MKKQKEKNDRRSKIPDASLKKRYNSKIRQEYLDLDYLDKLDNTKRNVKLPDGTMVTELEYMSIFMNEWNNAAVGKQSEARKNKFHRTAKKVKMVTDQNNRRNNDLFGVTKATNLLNMDGQIGTTIENNQQVNNNVEDAMIDFLDNMVELKNSSKDTDDNGDNT